MLNIAREHHLVVFDARQFYVASFVFEIVPQQSKNKNEGRADHKMDMQQVDIQLKDEYHVNFHVQNKFTYQWQSPYFDLEVQNSQINIFGNIPFSLQTFIDIYKNPKHWNIVLRLKTDQVNTQDILKNSIGKLTIKTNFIPNPFIVPIRLLNHSLQTDKVFKVLTQAIQGQQVLSSAQLQAVQIVDVGQQDFKIDSNFRRPQNFKLYTFRANSLVCCQNICFLKGQFYYKQLEHRNRKIKIYSYKKPISFIPNLQRTMKMLKFIDSQVIIVQNVDTNIQDTHKLVFFTDLTTLYAKIFRSYLYSKIFDKWIIQGMVHYSRENRHFQDIMQQLTDLLTQGQQFFPLCNSQYSFDTVWRVKAKFIYHVLANLSDSDLTQRIILEFEKKKKKLTSALIFKRMKNDIGKDKMKTIYQHQFINCTGINRIFYQMNYIQKQPKINITLRQRSLVCGIFRRYNRIRIKLEQNYRLVSPIMQRIIKKNEGRRSEMSGPLAVPKFLKCLPYFVGPVSIQIQNSQPFQQQLQKQNIFQKVIDAKANLRARKTTNKKNQPLSSQTTSWMMMDTGVTFPAVYKGKNLSQSIIQSLVRKTYQNQIQQLKVLNSISIKQHSQSLSICKLLIQKIKIKTTEQNSKISVKRKILQILPNFIAKANDITVWDEILQLLQLYQPVCYDYSQQGNLFLLSLIESIGNINYTLQFNIYFQQFHRIMLAISKFHHCISQQKFQYLHKQIFKSIMKWTSKYSFQILQQAKKYLQLTLNDPKMYLVMIKIIIQNVLPYIDQLKVTQSHFKVVKQIRELVNQHVDVDMSGTIRSVLFHYQTKINQTSKPPLQFLDMTFTQLENIKQKYFYAYDKCLDKLKQLLNKNRERYALQIQIQLLNEDQNYYLAEYLWKNMCSTESLHNQKIRLMWMKIYRIFYFYFTPIVTMVKLNKNASTHQFPLTQNQTFEILDNVMDFVPDIEWFSVYDSSSNKKKKVQKKKDVPQYNFDNIDKSIFTDHIQKNPGKDSPQQLTKVALAYLTRHYQNEQIKNSGEQRFKRIIEGLKAIGQLLKRGNMRTITAYQQIPEKVYTLLSQYNEDDEKAKEVFELLYTLIQYIRLQKRQKQLQKGGDMRISLIPLDFSRFQSIKQE